MRAVYLVATLSLAFAAPGHAQGIQPLGSPENTRRTGQVVPMFGLHFDHATGPSAHLAIIRTDLETAESYGGWLLSAEGGMRGGKFGVGRGGGPTAVFGGLVRIAWMRTWGTGGPLAPGQTFFGGDLRLTSHQVSASIGEYVRLRGKTPGDKHLLDFSFGLGF